MGIPGVGSGPRVLGGDVIEKFAEGHRVRVTRDACNDPIIAGRIGESNIYERSDRRLAVMFVTDGRKAPRTGLYNRFCAACLAAGMVQVQSGDGEGAFTFDPADLNQAKVALKGIRVRVKRKVTPEQLARLATMRNLARKPLVAAIC